jgi:hypothetical protein
VNDELERIWKEAVVPNQGTVTAFVWKSPVRIADVQTQIRTEYISNASHRMLPLDHLVRCRNVIPSHFHCGPIFMGFLTISRYIFLPFPFELQFWQIVTYLIRACYVNCINHEGTQSHTGMFLGKQNKVVPVLN